VRSPSRPPTPSRDLDSADAASLSQGARAGDGTSVLQKRRAEDFSKELFETGWYHSVDLPDGRIIKGFLSLDELRERFAEFPFPADLHGRRVLDIGTWDGWFAFESERRGAAVVAVDNIEQENFHYAHEKIGSKVIYEIAEVYELRNRHFEPFDYTLFLGVLYHLRHPLLALEIVCGLTKEVAIVDSFTVDDDYRGTGASPIPWMEFYETTELSNQIDNWVGPTVDCLLALCRSAGFARVELLNIKHRHARVACYRHWENPPESATAEAPVLQAAVNGRWGDNGINFYTHKEEFLTIWFSSGEPDLQRQDLRPEVGGFGVPALALHRGEGNSWHVNLYLPPGLRPGWHDVRLRTVRSGFSNPCRIAIDLSPTTDGVEIIAGGDGRTWQPGEVVVKANEEWGYLTLWITGLAENCDRNNVRVFSGSRRLPVDFVSRSSANAQVNARMPASLAGSKATIVVEHAGKRSNSANIMVGSD
jgi:tRNA (mo5U34)-methyltransferase